MKIKFKTIFFLSCLCCLYVVKAQVRPVVYPLFLFSLDSGITGVSQIFDDKIPDNVNCVGLGEVLHGGKEITEVKSKLVQYFVQKRGYRTFLFEYPNAAISLLNYYLSNNELTSFDTLKIIASNAFKGSVMVQDSSFMNLISWLKSFNLTHPTDIVSIKGVDIYGASGTFSDYFMYNFSKLLDSSTKAGIDKNWNKIAVDSIAQIILSWVDVHRMLVKTRLKNFYSDFFYNEQNAQYAIRHAHLQTTNIYNASFYRDSLMAENVEKLSLKQKSIFWAFNGHVSPFSNFSAGKMLKANYKDKYYTILTDFSNTATSYIKKNASTTVLPEHFHSKPSTVAYRLSKRYRIKSGILFYDEIKDRKKIGTLVESIDIRGNTHILGKQSFDALVIVEDIKPVGPK